MLALGGLLSLGLGVLQAAYDLVDVSFLIGGKGTLLSLVSVVLLSAVRGTTRRAPTARRPPRFPRRSRERR